VLGTTSSVATTLAPSLGGLLLSGLGWRALFLINVPLGALAYAVARRYLPEVEGAAPSGARSRFDWVGTLILVAVLVAYSLAMTESRVHGLTDGAVLGLLAGAAIGAALFVIVQARTKAPLVDLGLFRDLRIAAGAASSLLVAAIMMTTLLLAPFFLSRAVGLASGDIGLVMAVGPLTAALVGVPAGRLSDRIGASWTMVAGLVGLTAGAFWMAQVPPDVGVAGYALRVAVISGSYGFFQSPNNAAVMAAARADQRGVVSSLLNLSRNLGFITGASLMGAVFAGALHGSNRVAADLANASSEAVTSGMHAAFGLATGMSLMALLLAALTLYETIVRNGQRAL
jgi:MFS family permease